MPAIAIDNMLAAIVLLLYREEGPSTDRKLRDKKHSKFPVLVCSFTPCHYCVLFNNSTCSSLCAAPDRLEY